MTYYKKIFKESLEKLKKDGNYRIFADLEKIAGNFPQALNYKENSVSEVTVWCSNDYLGMSSNVEVINEMKKSASIHGVGTGSSPLITGYTKSHHYLEKELAEYQAKFKKDQELLETFDKQTEVKLDTQGITDGNTIRQNQQT